jgi:hypothetical protein
MGRLRALWRNAQQEWPRWAQVGGFLLGTWQVLEWKLAGAEPNAGVMGFAASLLLFQRARSKRRRDADE